MLTSDAESAAGLHEGVLRLAALTAELVVSKGQYSDAFERVRRALPMGVPSEMLWRQLPPLTFATDRFVLTAQLEPWHEVGGDAFDCSIDGALLRFAVLDGMGHGLGATLLAGVALAAYRKARRSGLGLIDLERGTIRTLCAAHPAPLLVRAGHSLGELDVDPGFPLGFGSRDDAVVEARSPEGEFFGTERLIELLVRQESLAPAAAR